MPRRPPPQAPPHSGGRRLAANHAQARQSSEGVDSSDEDGDVGEAADGHILVPTEVSNQVRETTRASAHRRGTSVVVPSIASIMDDESSSDTEDDDEVRTRGRDVAVEEARVNLRCLRTECNMDPMQVTPPRLVRQQVGGALGVYMVVGLQKASICMIAIIMLHHTTITSPPRLPQACMYQEVVCLSCRHCGRLVETVIRY